MKIKFYPYQLNFQKNNFLLLIFLSIFCSVFCFTILAHTESYQDFRSDGAVLLFESSSIESIQNPAFSPDGKYVIYTLFHEGYNKGPAGIYTYSISKGSSTLLIDEENNDSVNLPGASWNSVTNLITFASDRQGMDNIWTMSSDGSNLKQITNHLTTAYYIEPSFSPDGQWIVFEADTTEPDDTQQGSIYKVNVDGTNLVKLTDGPGSGTDDRQPNWSPSGNTILFQRRVPGSNNWDIYTIHPDGTGLKQITTSDSSDTDASFSPDGQWIVYSTDYGGLEMPNIFIIPSVGGKPVQITNSKTNEDGAPSWSPDGKWIAFESHKGADEDTPSTIWRIAVSMPAPLITANGTADTVNISENTPVTFTLSLDAATFKDTSADWWLLHVCPTGTIEYFDLKSMAFNYGILPTFQGKLVSFESISLASLSFTNIGTHWFYFGVDLDKNAQVDTETTFYDSVKVNIITDNNTTDYKAKPVYNQAYQENFEEDNVSDIIQNASNAYVLLDPFMPGISDKIEDIKENNNEIGCYISIGTGENWRSDFDQLKPYLVSKPWGKWEGEYFVSQTTTGIIPIIKTRIDHMSQWKCDWVEFDNMDWALDDNKKKLYGFQVTETEATAYFQELCDYVHQKGMKCMAKNMLEGASDFDGVLYESYDNKLNWWDNQETWNFLNSKKLVIINHYNETNCNKVYQDYKKIYNNNISFICEDVNLKKYVHYSE